MFYDAQLQFLRDTLKKSSIQTIILNPDAPLSSQQNTLFPSFSGQEELYRSSFFQLFPGIKSQTMYKLSIPHGVHYLFCLLPETPDSQILLIGPYLGAQLSQEEILEFAERLRIPPEQTPILEEFFLSLPVLQEGGYFFSMIDTFAELIWKGRNNYTMDDFSGGISDTLLRFPTGDSHSGPHQAQWNIQRMEARYQFENELMDAVAHGSSSRIDRLIPAFASVDLEQRLQDPVRNMKNYSIIMNTLFRKAAQSGGVHPIYLDQASSSFAHQIELMTSVDALQKLMSDMGYTYCKLVRKHSMKNFSAPVQKTILQIDADLTADLSLSTLSHIQNLSPGYLSALFRRETGQTLTDFVNKRRMDFARHLLQTTTLQIQTIAQHCGITDVQYFSRLFKKYTGMTPKEYRNS